ncbi:ComEC/Rec2 family competence protein [Paenibacillus polysaccharolyticus]|uniref:ComEC/Rec2 family competence protein n=1 Tax=Paenibacillus polysaccharolyticus TaxID=582692 RepID=UPI00203CBC5C|nr:ComEC/Rec2 family competence protein [Paenibacillus polysaccharolyticus]MCM3133918.1 ComEC/Rec2 family competence protein [Paenibacillus polysaccharolyticus]
MKDRPLLRFTIFWLSGSSMACLLMGWALFWGVVGAMACLPVLLRFMNIRGWSSLLLVTAFAGGLIQWEWNDSRNYSTLPAYLHSSTDVIDGLDAQVEGKLVSDVQVDGDRASFEMQISSLRLPEETEQEVEKENKVSSSDPALESLKSPGSSDKINERVIVQVRLMEEQEQQTAASWRRGDKLKLSGSLVLPGKARNFGGFDYRSYLRTQYIHWMVKVKGASSVHVSSPEGLGKINILRWTDSARQLLGSAVDRLFPEPQAGYMKGLIIGMAKDIDPGTYSQFSQLGLTHILAISGTHVAVYVASLLMLLSWLRLTRETALTIVLVLVPAYVLLSGGSPSVIRAGMMSMIGLYMAKRGYARDGIQIISAAAMLMLWWNPYFLLNVSFQLSFLVTAGLMIYMPLINRLFYKWPKSLAATASVTVTAQLISFPVTILYFNQFSLLSFAANFLLVSLISAVVLPLGTVAMILSFVWLPLAKLLAWIAIQLNQLTFLSVEWMNSLPGFVMIWPTPSLLWIATYYVILYVLLYLLYQRSGGEIPQNIHVAEEDTAPLDMSSRGATQRGSTLALGFNSSRSADTQSLYTAKANNRLQLSAPDPLPTRRATSDHGSLSTLGASIAWPEYASVFTSKGAGFYSEVRMSKVQRGLCVVLAICLIAGLWWAYQTPRSAGTGVVQFLDIGQGDSTLITTPEGKHILVDGGGTVNFGGSEHSWKTRRDPYEVGAKIVVPLLKKRGIHQLDAVIVTHADQDHAGGLQAVLDQIPVKRLMFNGTTSGKEKFDQLLNTAIQRQIPLFAIHQGMTYQPDRETSLYFISPERNGPVNPSGGVPTLENQNGESVVFLLDMAGSSLLFTGDMEAATEQNILYDIQDGSMLASFQQGVQKSGRTVPNGETNIGVVPEWMDGIADNGRNHSSSTATSISRLQSHISIDVLKVAHHGSKTSSSEAWLQYWNAKSALISAGVNNTYGHPNPGVMKRLEATGSQIYRTDQMGEVQVRVNDGKIDVRHKLIQNKGDNQDD